MKEKYDILFLDGNRSFIKRDFDILSKHFKVVPVDINKFSIPSLYRAYNLVHKSKLVYCWFGSPNTAILVFFSKMLGKKSIVVAGGVDVESLPEYNYGDMNTTLYKFIPKYCFANCDVSLPVSKFTEKELRKHTSAKNISFVFNCIDSKSFFPSSKIKRDSVLTVATGQKDVVLKKGLDVFVECARMMPKTKFVMVGLSKELIQRFSDLKFKNLILYGEMPYSKMLNFYQSAKVYCQLSLIESFGVALAESMLCECVPVVTRNAALPEVVGDTGFYCNYKDTHGTVLAIKKAFNSGKGKAARKRITTLFSIKMREKKIVSIIGSQIRKMEIV